MACKLRRIGPRLSRKSLLNLYADGQSGVSPWKEVARHHYAALLPRSEMDLK
jgi:hypothetical protein